MTLQAACDTTKDIKAGGKVFTGGDMVNVASSEKDKASQDFLWGYVREQVEEEATALGIVEKLKRCKDEASILYMDEKLGER